MLNVICWMFKKAPCDARDVQSFFCCPQVAKKQTLLLCCSSLDDAVLLVISLILALVSYVK